MKNEIEFASGPQSHESADTSELKKYTSKYENISHVVCEGLAKDGAQYDVELDMVKR